MGRKKLYEYFKLQIKEFSHLMTLTWLRRVNLKRETESLLIVAQNNALKTNYVRSKIDNTQKNIRFRLCAEEMKRLIT